MIVVKMQTQQIKIYTQNTLSKLLIVSLLLKNKNSDKLAFKNRIQLHKVDDSSSKKHIIITQKETKSLKSAHKLHSIHPFI